MAHFYQTPFQIQLPRRQSYRPKPRWLKQDVYRKPYCMSVSRPTRNPINLSSQISTNGCRMQRGQRNLPRGPGRISSTTLHRRRRLRWKPTRRWKRTAVARQALPGVAQIEFQTKTLDPRRYSRLLPVMLRCPSGSKWESNKLRMLNFSR